MLREQISRFQRLYSLEKLKSRAVSSDPSYAGEYKYLLDLVEKLKLTSGPVLDIAASDGYNQSSTLGFYRNGWTGLAVEMDPEKFATLSYLYNDFPGVNLAKTRVTPNNVISLLQAFEIPRDIAILNLDIDSYDLSVAKSLLAGGYRPQIISMEINEKIPVGIYFSVIFTEEHFWQGDHFYGCSVDAAVRAIKPYGYSLVSVQFNNAFFVKDSIANGHFRDLSSEDAWESGYKNHPDRKSLFPWNSDVEDWLECNPEEAIQFIQRFFLKYEGLYVLALTSSLSVGDQL